MGVLSTLCHIEATRWQSCRLRLAFGALVEDDEIDFKEALLMTFFKPSFALLYISPCPPGGNRFYDQLSHFKDQTHALPT